MPTSDPGEQRMYANEVRRHEKKLQQLAEHIHQYAGYLLREAQSDHPRISETHVRTIAADADEFFRRQAALDALRDFADVFAPASAPEEG